MVCEYSRAYPLSSANHQSPQERLDAPMAVGTRATSSARTVSAMGSMMCGRLSSCNTLLERLAQHLQDGATEFRKFIETQNTMVRPRHVAR
jgi:hypothetical protein